MRADRYLPGENPDILWLEQKIAQMLLYIARYKHAPTKEELTAFHDLEQRYIALYQRLYCNQPPLLPSKAAARFVKAVSRARNQGARIAA